MQRNTGQELHKLRCGVTILPEQSEAFARLTTELLTQVPANLVLLVDVAGQVVMTKGSHDNVDLIMLGSLVAGDLAASQEIARLTNQYQDYQIVLREGENFNTFIIEAGDYLALLVQVEREVPLGWARMVIKRMGQSLAQVMENAELSAETEAAFILDDPNDELSDLFGEALDDLWGEL